MLEEPELVYREQPDYPAEARKYRASGEVVVQVVVTREGTIRDPHVVEASHPAFIDPTLEAVAKWRFEPATCDGRPVEMIFHVYSHFEIR